MSLPKFLLAGKSGTKTREDRMCWYQLETTENMQILNMWPMWYVWLQNEPLFELKELSKEEGKQYLNGKTGRKKALKTSHRLLPFFRTSL